MVPKTIHQCYFPNEGYEEYWKDEFIRKSIRARYISKCRPLAYDTININSDFKYQLFTYDKMPCFSSHVYRDPLAIKALILIRSDKIIYTLKTDIFRLLILYYEGGIYHDNDFRTVKNYSPLINCKSFCAKEQSGLYASSFMGAEPGLSYIRDALEMTVNLISSHLDKCNKTKYNVLNSGFYIASNYLMNCEKIYPTEYFFPFFCNELERREEGFPDSYAVHLWSGSDGDGWAGKLPTGDPDNFDCI